MEGREEEWTEGMNGSGLKEWMNGMEGRNGMEVLEYGSLSNSRERSQPARTRRLLIGLGKFDGNRLPLLPVPANRASPRVAPGFGHAQ